MKLFEEFKKKIFTVTYVNGYWVDRNNNMWNSTYYTKEDAIACSKSLMNCYNCTDCGSCTNCENCRECNWCSNSTRCDGCGWSNNCTWCHNCDYCSSCINLKGEKHKVNKLVTKNEIREEWERVHDISTHTLA